MKISNILLFFTLICLLPIGVLSQTIDPPITVATGISSSGPLLGYPRIKGGILNNLLWMSLGQGDGNDPAFIYSADGGSIWNQVAGNWASDYHISGWTQSGVGVHMAYPGIVGACYRFITTPATSWGNVGPEIILRTTTSRCVSVARGDTVIVAARGTTSTPTDDVYIFWSTDNFNTIHYDTVFTGTRLDFSVNIRIFLGTDATGLPCLWVMMPSYGWFYLKWGGPISGFISPTDAFVTGSQPYAGQVGRVFSVRYAANRWHLLFGFGSTGSANLHYFTNPGGVWVHDTVSMNSVHGGIEFYPVLGAYHQDTVLIFYRPGNTSIYMKMWDAVSGISADSLLITGSDISFQDAQVPYDVPDTMLYMPVWYTQNAAVPFNIRFTKVNFFGNTPAVYDIPNQSIYKNATFSTIILDNYVYDIDNHDTTIVWTYAGETDLTVDITNRIATITAPVDWVGSETITFIATDPGLLTDSDNATFTISEQSKRVLKGWKK